MALELSGGANNPPLGALKIYLARRRNQPKFGTKGAVIGRAGEGMTALGPARPFGILIPREGLIPTRRIRLG